MNASPEIQESGSGETETQEETQGDPQEDSQEGTQGEPPEDSRLKWYALHTYSGYENKVKQTIEHKSTLEGLREQIVQVIIPTEMVVEIKGGKKRTTPRNLMPGYVLVHIEPIEMVFDLIKNVKGVSTFVGDGHEPIALTKAEVDNLLDIMEDKHEKPKPKMLYRKGDQVKVIEGPFMNFVGNVDTIDEEKSKLSVMVSIFGRLTPVELDVLQVEPT